MSKEYGLCLLAVAAVLGTYAIAFYNLNYSGALIIGLFSSILGAFLVAFGFWGADFAFGMATGYIKNQSGQPDRMVYVPFLGNYTPLEWWNFNWFIVTVGAGLLCLGTFVVGWSLARLLFL